MTLEELIDTVVVPALPIPILLMEEILHQLIGSVSHYLPESSKDFPRELGCPVGS